MNYSPVLCGGGGTFNGPISVSILVTVCVNMCVYACVCVCVCVHMLKLKGRLCFHKRLSVHKTQGGRVYLVPYPFRRGGVGYGEGRYPGGRVVPPLQKKQLQRSVRILLESFLVLVNEFS